MTVTDARSRARPRRSTDHDDCHDPPGQAPRPELAHWHAALTAITLAVIVGSSLYPALGHGLSTDEFLSVWVSADGIGETVARANEFQGNSPVYFVFLGAWRSVAGGSEWMLRLPSALAVVASSVLLGRLARSITDRRGAEVVAAAALLGQGLVIQQASTARPYGLLILAATGATWALWQWLRTGRRVVGLVWIVCLVVGVALSPLAATLGVAHLVVLIDARRAGPLPTGLGGLIASGVVLALPLAPQMLSLAGRRDDLVLSAPPDVLEVFAAMVPIVPLGILAVLALVSGPARWGSVDGRALRLAIISGAIPPLLVAVAGALGDSPLWMGRYYIVAVPGAALAVAISWASLPRFAATVGLVALVTVAAWNLQTSESWEQGWREVIAWAAEETAGDDDVVLALTANLIESNDADLLEDPRWHAYLTAPASYYDELVPAGAVIGLPRESATSDAYFRRHLPDLVGHRTVVIVDGLDGIPSPDWFEVLGDELAAAGYTETRGPDHARLGVAVWRRDG